MVRGTKSIFLLFLGLSGGAQAQPAPHVRDGSAAPVYEAELTLTAFQLVNIETRNLTAGADPVLHLLNPTGIEVAVDDNGNGGKSARIFFKVQESGKYRLIARAKDANATGRCDLHRSGQVLATGVELRGWFLTYTQISAGEEIETVRSVRGPREHRLYLLRETGLGIERRVASGGTAGGVAYRFAGPRASATFMVGAPLSETPGQLRVLRNDRGVAGHDPDGDGLGLALENALGTCSTRTGTARGFKCSVAADPRDTDGDGLSDGLEVLGRRDKLPHQPLPLWGANPRHKDLFLEVDFMLRSPEEAAQKMTPAQAREFARYFQDQSHPLTTEQAAAHAATLKNPDGRPGISVHLDIGESPTSIMEATLFGDWGGYNAVPPVRNERGEWQGVNYASAFWTHMAAPRLGVFRYMLPYASGAGSNGPGYACASGLDSIRTLAHECGHALGLWSHSLEPEGSPDVNCKPNHPSLIDYAYLGNGWGFADGTGRAPLNNASLQESGAVPPPAQVYLNDLQNVFSYNVDFSRGDVDWNRNGVFEPAGKRVRAYANYQVNGECEYTKENEAQVGGADAMGSPALARLGGRIYAFYVDRKTSTVRYRFSTSAWNCESPNTNCGSWQGGGIASDNSIDLVGGIDAATIGNRIVLIAISRSGYLWQRELTVSSGNESWTGWEHVPDVVRASGEPALESDSTRLVLVYKVNGQEIRYRVRGLNQAWSASQAVLSNGQPAKTSPVASPGLAVASLKLGSAAQPESYGFYGAFPDANGLLDVWYFNIPSGQWEKTSLMAPRMGPVQGRTAMAYAPYRSCCNSSGGWDTRSSGGTLYLYYITLDSVVGMMMSHTALAGGTPQPQRIGLQAHYQNSWYYAHGLDAMADYYDSGSFFVLVTMKGKSEGQVWLRPRSDGQLNYMYSNKNDWEFLGRSLCPRLRGVGSYAPEPRITCPW